MSEFVILVDENDNQIGLEDKFKCHLPDGRLHRAFTAMLFDYDGRLALAKRSEYKMLWPDCWDGTFASHPREKESYEVAGIRRLSDELYVGDGDLDTDFDYMNKFEYHVPYKDVGSENEICATLISEISEPSELRGDIGEIGEIRWASARDLRSEIKANPGNYCPWMLIAIKLLEKSDRQMLEVYDEVLEPWMGMGDELAAAIRTHLPDSQWRQVR